MISPNLLQAQVVTALQGNATLVAALPELGAGIREAEWHGTDFQYPCVRVRRPALEVQPNGGRCLDAVANATFMVDVHSKRDTSRIAQEILGLVEAALRGQTLNTADLSATALRPTALAPVSENPENETIWSGSATFRTVVSAR